MLDEEGFRPNVAIVIMNNQGQLFWAKRRNQEAWQFPQGGINPDETPIDAMYRELFEEVGLQKDQVKILASTPGWLKYRLPERYLRINSDDKFVGQKQKWFLLLGDDIDTRVDFNKTELPEFDAWSWVDYWHPVRQVVDFKRGVYRRALQILHPSQQSFLANSK